MLLQVHDEIINWKFQLTVTAVHKLVKETNYYMRSLLHDFTLVRTSLKKAGTELLESHILVFKIYAPQEYLSTYSDALNIDEHRRTLN